MRRESNHYQYSTVHYVCRPIFSLSLCLFCSVYSLNKYSFAFLLIKTKAKVRYFSLNRRDTLKKKKN